MHGASHSADRDRLRVSPHATPGNVETLGAMVRELDRSLVPEIEAAVGPSREEYQPEG